MTAAMAAEELTTSQQKLQKRINDLKEEISREKSLRASLEDSHNTLLTRVREMESIVEVERNEVIYFLHNSVKLENSNFGPGSKEKISREKSLRVSLEDSHNTLLTRVREMESIVEVGRNEVHVIIFCIIQ